MQDPLTILVDGHYQLHRTMHIAEFMQLSHNGVFTGGIFGVLKILRNVLSKFNVGRVVFAWDGGRSKRRLSLYSNYKKNDVVLTEEKAKEKEIYYKDFNDSIYMLTNILQHAGVHVVRWPEREGDDLIGFMARHVLTGPCIVASDDWDYAQMVSDRITMYRPMYNQYVTPANFEENLKCPQDWFLFRKAIDGDGSDNIDGVEGVGKVTIKTLIDDYRSAFGPAYPGHHNLGQIFSFAQGHKSKLVRRIAAAKDQILMNLSLVDIAYEEFPANAVSILREKMDKRCAFSDRELLVALGGYGMHSMVSTYSTFSEPFRKLV